MKSLNNFHSVKGALLDFRFLKILSFWILYEKLIEWESKIKAENLLYLEIVVIPENTWYAAYKEKMSEKNKGRFLSYGVCNTIYWEGGSWEGIQIGMCIDCAQFEMSIR